MLPFRRGCFAKYIVVTFSVLFAYTFLAGVWIPRENAGTNFVNGNPDINHKILALAQINGKDSVLADIIVDPSVQVLPHSNHSLQTSTVPTTTSQSTTPRSTTVRLTQPPTHHPTKRPTQRPPQRPLTKSPASKSVVPTKAAKSVNVTTPYPLGEDNTWNFTVTNNPHPFKFLKNASDVCTNRRIFLLNIIHSKPSNLWHRNVIRKTWGNSTANEKLRTATVFVLGRTNDVRTEAAVETENQKYHDIVQEDFLDSYRNLTHKSIAVLRWITNFCPNAEFVLKTDDDVFVNIFDVSRLIRRQLLKEPNATKIMCQLSNRNVLREKKYKWYVPEKEYPYKRYPPYCMGVAFIMPGSVVPKLYNASFTTKFFWIDDVYSTGMLAHVAKVSHVNIVKKFVYKAADHRDRLVFGDAAIAHVAGGPNAEKKEKYWKEILKIELNEA